MARIVAEKADVVPVLAEIFRQHGYEGTSIGIISERSGLGRGSLYHFFPGGKADMAAAVLDHVSDWFEVNVFRPLEVLPPEAAINTMLDAVLTYFEGGQRVCIVGAFALDQTRDRFAGAVGSYFARWVAVLAACLRRMEPSAGTCQEQAHRMIATIQGGIVLARATGDAETFRTLINELRPNEGRTNHGAFKAHDG